ncbi:TATA box-binding protein-associated factor RNA polymerase I subunit B isoform X2 [Tribolium castaneum]|uniref:TATA box-binding protein-associated factor RNA polymerase I subunit B isoform X2 n=1 Tax=Tribolium castaneum TaxID=7070 RepID=UPI0030FE9224
MQDIVCEQCGGVDFYKEAGFYFCSGCQIQSQEVQEYVYDEYTPETRLKTKKIQSDKTAKTENKITSWECYNYILLGLTNELINLGADKKLKAVVRLLWMRYLEKLQVFKLGRDELPKLQAVCSNMDAEIVYGKLAKKKRKRNKSSSSELDVTSLDSTSLKHERVKRKRALAKAQYEEFSKKSQETPSLHNETLTSLQTDNDIVGCLCTHASNCGNYGRSLLFLLFLDHDVGYLPEAAAFLSKKALGARRSLVGSICML